MWNGNRILYIEVYRKEDFETYGANDAGGA